MLAHERRAKNAHGLAIGLYGKRCPECRVIDSADGVGNALANCFFCDAPTNFIIFTIYQKSVFWNAFYKINKNFLIARFGFKIIRVIPVYVSQNDAVGKEVLEFVFVFVGFEDYLPLVPPLIGKRGVGGDILWTRWPCDSKRFQDMPQ